MDGLTVKVDFLEAGSSGPVVMLVHSSVAGARQWRRLMDDLKDQFRVRAVNLYGYGKTPPWPNEKRQTLDDQARLVEAALPAGADDIYLVGHSFGGSVAVKAAARLKGRVSRLVLLEPTLGGTATSPTSECKRCFPQTNSDGKNAFIVAASSIALAAGKSVSVSK